MYTAMTEGVKGVAIVVLCLKTRWRNTMLSSESCFVLRSDSLPLVIPSVWHPKPHFVVPKDFKCIDVTLP